VFAWPGVATLTGLDPQPGLPVVSAVVLPALIIVIVNAFVDLIVGLIEPRIGPAPDGGGAGATGRPAGLQAPSPRRCGGRRQLGRLAGVWAARSSSSSWRARSLPRDLAHDPLNVDIKHRMAPPAWMEGGTPEHLLGTDQIGRDLLARLGRPGLASWGDGGAAVRTSGALRTARAISRAKWTGAS
jgi:hypothetical protein